MGCAPQVDTEVFEVLEKMTGMPKAKLLEWAKSENELHEICTPEEIAGPILFLASDAASFISGVHVPVAAAAQVQLEIEDAAVFFARQK
jgi:NAD(P)-dependent dehydrogenase (short-subunit alcohol dehydrogenase family)